MRRRIEIEMQTDASSGKSIISARGELSIWTAAELKSALVGKIEAGGPLILDLREIEFIDITGLQLLCSAHRSCVARGAGLTVGETSRALADTARLAGYRHDGLVCPLQRAHECIWKL